MAWVNIRVFEIWNDTSSTYGSQDRNPPPVVHSFVQMSHTPRATNNSNDSTVPELPCKAQVTLFKYGVACRWHLKTMHTVGNPDWPCRVPECSGFIAVKSKHDGNKFDHCDQQVFRDNPTCQVSCSIFRAEHGSEHNCLVCIQDVAGTPSAGKGTGDRDSRGPGNKFRCIVL